MESSLTRIKIKEPFLLHGKWATVKNNLLTNQTNFSKKIIFLNCLITISPAISLKETISVNQNYPDKTRISANQQNWIILTMLTPSFLALEWFASITFQIKTIVLETEEQWKAALCIKISFLCSFHKFWFCRYPLYIPCIIRSAVYNIIAPYNCKLSLASQCILSDF